MKRDITRRDFLAGGASVIGTGALGAVVAGPMRGRAHAFPPDDWIAGFARMVFHENPEGPSPRVFEALDDLSRRTRASGGLMCYPDFEKDDLKRAILRYSHVEGDLGPDNIVLGVGSTESLMMAADVFTSPVRATLTEWPTYRIFLQRAEQNGSEIIKVPLRDPDLRPDFEAMKALLQAREDIGLVHFNVVNNPVGTFADRDELDAFLLWVFANRPDVVVLADDSDPEFIEPGSRDSFPRVIDYVVGGHNIIHVQTFSHAFGMTGLRLGYVIARDDLVERLLAKKIYAGVSATAHTAGLASLADARAQVARSFQCNDDGRRMLYGEFDRMGLRYLRSHGAFVMVEIGMDSPLAYLQMMRRKVLIRWGSEWDMNEWIRVNPGTAAQNERFIEALEDMLSGGSRRTDPLDLLDSDEGRRLEAVSARLGLFPRQALMEQRNRRPILPRSLRTA